MKTILERVIPLTPAQEEIFAASMVDANESISDPTRRLDNVDSNAPSEMH